MKYANMETNHSPFHGQEFVRDFEGKVGVG